MHVYSTARAIYYPSCIKNKESSNRKEMLSKLSVLRVPTRRSLSLCQRFCSSQQPPKAEESPGNGIVILKFILRNLVIGAAGLGCGYGLSEYLKSKGVPTDPTREKAKRAKTDPDELANVQGAITERVYLDVTSEKDIREQG